MILDPDATADDVSDMIDALQHSIANLLTGDKTDLEALVWTIDNMNSGNYTPDSWNAMGSAFGAARKVLADEYAEDAAVKEAFDALTEKFLALKLTTDKTDLDQMIGKAENILANSDEYAPSLLVGLEEEIAKAKARYKAHKAELEASMHKAQAIDQSNYTQASVIVLKAVMADAQIVLDDRMQQRMT